MAACPNCSLPLADTPEYAGQFVACPKCGTSFPLPPPIATPVSPVDPFKIETRRAPSPAVSQPQPINRGFPWLASLGLAIVIYGGLLMISTPGRQFSNLPAMWDAYHFNWGVVSIGFCVLLVGLAIYLKRK